MRHLTVTLFSAVCWLLLACDDVTRPSEPAWNKQPCAHCHMILSEPRYAAQLIDDAGDRQYFDDIGCMATYVSRHPAAARKAWVHLGKSWVLASSTRYSTHENTPMGYGFAPDARSSLDFASVVLSVADTSTPRAQP